MQTFVAYVARGRRPETIREAVACVERRYARRWAHPPRRDEAHAAGSGLVLWQGPSISRWPAWAIRGDVTVASLYAPVGYERVVAAEPLATAPLRLADQLDRHPGDIEDICPPFVCARLDTAADRLTLHTDALGVGRLYTVRTADGWVWSNRPEAALAFADTPARADEFGWQHIAVADELFGHVTAYEGVRAVDAATTIDWDGRAGRLSVGAIDTVVSWAAADPAQERRDLIESAADQLTSLARSVTRLYADSPVVDLTGGRDSRLVAAAFLAAGVDLTLHTHDALPGDLATARDLVALLPDPPPHRIEHVATGGLAPPRPWRAMTNAAGWHAFSEGLRPYSYLHHEAPAHLDQPRPLAIGGAGGEVAHGYFYPAGIAELEALPRAQQIDAFADVIVRRYAPVPGAAAAARAQVRAWIVGSLRDLADRGHPGAAVLDVFYLRERIRRWGSTGERPGIVSPLLATSFLRAALSLTPAQRRGNDLHRELTRRLAPAWADVPYFPAERGAVPPTAAQSAARPAAPRVVRVGQALDRDAVHSLLLDAAAWADPFDEAHVLRLWQQSVAGSTDARGERVLRAAVWRGAFTDHLAGLAGTPVHRPHVPWSSAQPADPEPPATTAPGRPEGPGRPERPERLQRLEPAQPPALSTQPGGAGTLAGIAHLQAQSVRLLARRLARSRAWAAIRETPAGTLVRRGAATARRAGVRL